MTNESEKYIAAMLAEHHLLDGVILDGVTINHAIKHAFDNRVPFMVGGNRQETIDALAQQIKAAA